MYSLMFKKLVTTIFAIFFIWIGLKHFYDPDIFEPIVPKIIGYPRFWVYFSGIIEMILGFLLLFKKYRKFTSMGLVILLILLYIANLNMWINDIPVGNMEFTTFQHKIRLFIQVIMILSILFIGNFEMM